MCLQEPADDPKACNEEVRESAPWLHTCACGAAA
jgi:hypothetical protein